MEVVAISLFAAKVAEKMAISIVAEQVKEVGKQLLGPDKSAYTKELEKTIHATILEYDLNYNIPDEGQRFAFYKSEILIQSLLTIKFIGRDRVNIDEVKRLLEQNSNIISPKQADIFKFLDLFEDNCRKSPILIQHQFRDNYKDAIFEILGVVDLIQSTLNKIISEIRPSLTEEYFIQLNEIQQNIYSFKPKTALERLDSLEKRINEGNKMTPEVESRLLFLKGTCLLELDNGLEGPKLIVRAYLVSKNNSLRSDVALAFFNLKEEEKAKELADEIIETDPFSSTAWFLLLLLSKGNFKEVWAKIPKSVKDKRGFTVNVIHDWLLANPSEILTIDELGLKMPEEVDPQFTHVNFKLWEKTIYIKLHNYFSSVTDFSFDEKGRLKEFNVKGLEGLTILLKKFFDTIKDTEVYANYPMLRFYYFFCCHLANENSLNEDDFREDYLKLKESAYQFDLFYAEYLANSGRLDTAITILNDSKFCKEENVFLHRIIYTRTNGQHKEALKLLEEHIEEIEEIDFGNIFNLINLFRLLAPEYASLRNEVNRILGEKRFSSDHIKELFRLTIQISYFPSENKSEETAKQLSALANSLQPEAGITFHIAQLLYKIEAFKDCAILLEALVEPQKQTQVNLLYAECRVKGNIDLKSLLSFLEKIRLSNENNLYPFLAIEANLRYTIDDIVGSIDICWRGVKQYPKAEHFHVNLLSALELQGLKGQITEYVSKYLQRDFQIQRNGIQASAILGRCGFQNEASLILYELASKPTNYEARTSFATKLDFPAGFFIDYDEVEAGSFVKLSNGSKNIKLIELSTGDKYALVGKKRGELVLIPGKLDTSLQKFRIARIMNKHLFLFEQILHEASDSNSEIDIETFDFTNDRGEFDIKAFEEHFIKRFAPEESAVQKIKIERIEAYNKGELSFSEFCRGVFNDKMLNCYEYLCSNMFFALPAYHNSLLTLSGEEVLVLDFTSLFLLSDLKQKYGIATDKQFTVSTNLIVALKSELISLETSPPSKMTLTFVGERVQPIFYPEDYHQKQIDKYKILLQFTTDHCIEKIIEEKVEFTSFFESREKESSVFKCLIDNAMFCTNLQHTLITNDRFILNSFGHLNPKIISPENFLMRHFKGKFPKEIVDYFVENHYVGIIMNKDVLVNEYKKKQLNGNNSFNSCLASLKFRWSLSPVNMTVAIKFLKDIYAENLALDSEKFLLSQSVFLNLLDGCSQDQKVISLIGGSIRAEFALMGEALDRVLSAYESALMIYGHQF